MTLSQIKTATGSNAPLLGQDATQAGERRIPGVPLLVSPAVAVGTVWAYDVTRVWTVLRQDVTLDVDSSRYFESDRVAIRGTLRVRVRPQAVHRPDHGGLIVADTDTNTDTVSVTVVDGWAVCVDGEQRSGGATVDVPAYVAER